MNYDPETDSIICPICSKKMKVLTATHLKMHSTTTAQISKDFPGALFAGLKMTKVRSEKSAASFAANPKNKDVARRNGERLASMRASLSEEENSEIQRRSTETLLEKFSPEERSEKARAGGFEAQRKHPELRKRGAKALRKFGASEEGRKFFSENTKQMWTRPGHKENIRAKNSAHAISGRIPVVFAEVKPSRTEKVFIRFLSQNRVDLPYVGDGKLRISVEKGNRHWRNPDFLVSLERRRAVLLDAFAWGEREEEMQDYASAGWTILRVDFKELKDPPRLLEKLKTFISG